jgi:hypothetical protein
MIFERAGAHLRRNVVAYAALLIAMSLVVTGTAWAPTAIERNSIGTRQLEPGAVHSSDIGVGAVRVKHLGFPLTSKGMTIPQMAVADGASQTFQGPSVDGTTKEGAEPHLFIMGTVQMTNPNTSGPPRGAAAVTYSWGVRGQNVGQFEVDIADGETQSVPAMVDVAAVSGFQDVDLEVRSQGADITVDGGTINVAVLPAVQ